MYNEFSVADFRGIKSIQLSGLGRINLISGRNDTGKTSVLEALFLHAAGPFAPFNALGLRTSSRAELPLDLAASGGQVNPWASYFAGFDVATPIRMSSVSSGLRYVLEIVGDSSEPGVAPVVSASASGSTNRVIGRLLLRETRGDEETKERKVVLRVQVDPEEVDTWKGRAPSLYARTTTVQVISDPPPSDDELTFAFFASNRGADPALAEKYSRTRQHRSKLQLVDALQGLDDRIRDLEVLSTGGQSTLNAVLKNDLLIPLNLLGGGPMTVANILLGIADSKPGSIILLDEVENGVHWSAMEHMWRAVYRAAHRFEVQVFATTHSRECLVAAARALSQKKGDVRLFRLGHPDNAGSQIVGSYDYDKLLAGLEMDLDLR